MSTTHPPVAVAPAAHALRYPPASGAPPTPSRQVRDTSAQALAAGGMRKLGRQSQDVVDVVLGAQRNGARDLSLREIQQSYERLHGRRIDISTVSARVNALVAAGRLQRTAEPRQCGVTGMSVRPVCVPASQAALFQGR